jgi:hypothetical protein
VLLRAFVLDTDFLRIYIKGGAFSVSSGVRASVAVYIYFFVYIKGRAFSVASSVRASVAAFKISLQNHELIKYMLATLIYRYANVK